MEEVCAQTRGEWNLVIREWLFLVSRSGDSMCVGVGEVLSAVGRAVRPEAHTLAALNSERICPRGGGGGSAGAA